MSLFSFQGKVMLAERTAQGKAVKFTWLGNVPTLQLQLQTNNVTKNESYTGNRLQIGMLAGSKTANLNLTADEWTAQSIALALYATSLDIAGSTVTGEALPSPLAAGDLVRLEHGFISDLVLDDAGTPLVLGTDYSIYSESAGIIEMLTAQADPIEADYEYAAVQAATIFTEQPPERWLMLDGINTDNNEPVLLDLYKVRFNPVGDLSLITDEYGNIPLTASVLYDPLNAGDANLGGFGRVRNKAAV